jgi:hypothetical protein
MLYILFAVIVILIVLALNLPEKYWAVLDVIVVLGLLTVYGILGYGLLFL